MTMSIKQKLVSFTHPKSVFNTYIIQMSHKMMCREVEDLRHDLGIFLLNELNTPWVLSRLRLKLNFWFWF